MPELTARRAAFVAALAACLVYVTALGNGWALDDVPLVRDNAAAHSLSAAVGNFFEPYWPPLPDGEGGLYRPLVVLSYALDWTLSGGREWWFHAQNVLLHALATGLVVVVLLAWLPPLGALTAGLVFAVHPVHVEAVANVVGRAEIMAACGILLAVLAARRYRRAGDRWKRLWWAFATLAATGAALFSKEHGVVTVGVLALDHLLDPGTRDRPTLPLYFAVLGVTIGWLFLWRATASAQTAYTVAAAIRWLSPAERLAVAVPAQLEVFRLLVWPMLLVTDYGPELVPRRTEWSVVATVALAVSAAVLALAFAVARRAPAVAFAILVGAATYAPTSNLVFPSGVLLAERTLYLAALAPSAVVGWMAVQSLRARARRFLAVAAATLLVVYGARTLSRAGKWESSVAIVVEDLLEAPQNYRSQVRAGEMFAIAGDSARALTLYMTAADLFYDPMIARHSVPTALAVGRTGVALDHARASYDQVPGHALIAKLLVETYVTTGKLDSALAVSRRTIELSPGSLLAHETHLALVQEMDGIDWWQHLARARLHRVRYELAAAGAQLDSAMTAAASAPDLADFCWELEATRSLLGGIHPGLFERLSDVAAQRGAICR
jgi:hypothetical protein